MELDLADCLFGFVSLVGGSLDPNGVSPAAHEPHSGQFGHNEAGVKNDLGTVPEDDAVGVFLDLLEAGRARSHARHSIYLEVDDWGLSYREQTEIIEVVFSSYL